MPVNENVIKGKWLEIRGEVQKAWGKLTNDELDKTEGDMKSIGGLIQQKYGKAQADHESKLKSIFHRFQDAKEKKSEQIKDALKK